MDSYILARENNPKTINIELASKAVTATWLMNGEFSSAVHSFPTDSHHLNLNVFKPTEVPSANSFTDNQRESIFLNMTYHLEIKQSLNLYAWIPGINNFVNHGV